MDPNTYQQLACKTGSPKNPISVTAAMDSSLTEPHRVLHAGIGLATESGELLDALKKELFYGKPADRTNLIEEFGDLLWYIAVGLDALGCSMEDCMHRNIRKLQQRYPHKFTEEAALNRNLDAEREALEASEPERLS